MPQLEIATFYSQLFWLIICFSIIILFSWRISLPRLATLLQQRWEQIEGQKKLAHALRLEAEALQKIYDKDLELSRHRAKEIILQADHQIKLKFDQERIRISQTMKTKIKETEHHLIEKKEEISKEMVEMVHQLTLEIIKKILNKETLSSELAQTFRKPIKESEMADA
jgi:F-type H+-transporting ATPase subunit b